MFGGMCDEKMELSNIWQVEVVMYGYQTEFLSVRKIVTYFVTKGAKKC